MRRLLLLLGVLALVSCASQTPVPDVLEWQAEWIGAPWDGDEFDPSAVQPAPEFRKLFRVDRRVRRATAHVTGLGFFELYLNGTRVGDEIFCPNESSYGHRQNLMDGSIPMDDSHWRGFRVYYLNYDLTNLLRRGENTLGALLGNGFYATGRRRWVAPYGTPRLLCQLEIEYADGTSEVIASGTDWQVRRSPIVLNDLFEGEIYDARLEDAAPWEQAVPRKAPDGRLLLQDGPADRVMEVLEPRSVQRMDDGRWEVDFGEYVTGWVRLLGFEAPEGTRISLEFPVEGDYNGVYHYICRGGAVAEYAPRFVWWSFDKVIVSGWPGELRAEHLRAEVVHSDVRESASFNCSNPDLVRLHRIWKRTQTDNMHLGVATDCPHREKGPYTGDGQVACSAVMHNFAADRFYRKWLRDMSDCQDLETGYVPNGAPWHPGCGGGVAWGAAMVIIPWEHYLHYGDPSVLEEHYGAMTAQLRFMERWRTEEGIMRMQMPLGGGESLYWMNLGEWCPAYRLPDDSLVHTYYLWKCARILSETARVLGREDDALRCDALAGSVWEAFHRVFYHPESQSYGQQDGANVFALAMGVPEAYRAQVVGTLQREIGENGGHLNTGIFGTQLFFDVLCDNGLAELAYAVMTNRTRPGYFWWLEQGAKTFWEEWGGGNSHNHPMFGSGLVWLYTRIAGLQIDGREPAYRHIIIRPTPVGDLRYAFYETETPLGKASVRWERSGGVFKLEARVPRGAHATLWLPGADEPLSLKSGRHTFRTAE